ncbi:uncharacterized protein K02A2.6-like [Ornithodoros turicata]|uniref:uncharacterized protein K02A2.6-like n=1 Tax=Ornithodoros turicata TaxID=34597 RepID=UPI0031392CF0
MTSEDQKSSGISSAASMSTSSAHRAMALIGQVEPFDESISHWPSYEERLKSFLRVNRIPDNDHVDAFLSIVGGKTFELLKNLCSPELPASKTLDELLKVLRDHLSPRPSVIAERAKFHNRSQQENETMAEFVAELKHLAEHCNFGRVLDEMLRDRFVAGLLRVDIQKSLFTEDDSLSFKKAVEKAFSLERATRNAAECHVRKPNSFESGLQKFSTQKDASVKKSTCHRCGSERHAAHQCSFKNATCFKCRKIGHIAAACASVKRQNNQHKRTSRNTLKKLSPNAGTTQSVLKSLNSMKGPEPITFDMEIERVPLRMELDTGAAVSVISWKDFKQKFPKLKLLQTSLQLKTYTGETVIPCGLVNVSVNHKDFQGVLPLHVLPQAGPPLIGRDWLRQVRLDWQSLHQVKVAENRSVTHLLQKFSHIFSDDVGMITNDCATLILKPDATPRFVKARSLPLSLKPAVEKEIERLIKNDVWTPVQTSEYATPIVPVVKKDGGIRLCGDYKVTLNPQLVAESYPLPRIDEMLAALAGGRYYSKIDLSRAYYQVVMSEQSKRLLTVNTHKGLFAVNRLPFGVVSAPALFQRIMDNMLKGLNDVVCYLDDILVMGRTQEEHSKNLEQGW